MSQKTELRLSVPHQGVEHVHAVLDAPEEGAPRAAFVLAHGSGAPLSSDFLEAVAPAIADAAGLAVLRFNYGYAELMIRSGKPRPPERRPALEVVHRVAIAHARTVLPELPVILGGKSLGGRIASLMVAEGEPAAGLCFLATRFILPGRRTASARTTSPASRCQPCSSRARVIRSATSPSSRRRSPPSRAARRCA